MKKFHQVVKFVPDFLHISHRRTSTQKTPNSCSTGTCASNPKSLQIFCVRDGPFRTRTVRHCKDGSRWACRSRRRSGGCAAPQTKHVFSTHLTLRGTLYRHRQHDRHRPYGLGVHLSFSKSESGPLECSFFFLNVPQMGRNAVFKNYGSPF